MDGKPPSGLGKGNPRRGACAQVGSGLVGFGFCWVLLGLRFVGFCRVAKPCLQNPVKLLKRKLALVSAFPRVVVVDWKPRSGVGKRVRWVWRVLFRRVRWVLLGFARFVGLCRVAKPCQISKLKRVLRSASPRVVVVDRKLRNGLGKGNLQRGVLVGFIGFVWLLYIGFARSPVRRSIVIVPKSGRAWSGLVGFCWVLLGLGFCWVSGCKTLSAKPCQTLEAETGACKCFPTRRCSGLEAPKWRQQADPLVLAGFALGVLLGSAGCKTLSSGFACTRMWLAGFGRVWSGLVGFGRVHWVLLGFASFIGFGRVAKLCQISKLKRVLRSGSHVSL